MSELLQTMPLPMDLKNRQPLFLEFPKPFRISPSKLYNLCLVGGSAQSLLWVNPKGLLRVAPNPTGRISDYDIAKAISQREEFTNHFDFNPKGVHDAIRHIRFSYTGRVIVLHGGVSGIDGYPDRYLVSREVGWLNPEQAVMVPELLSELGVCFTSPVGEFVVVQNPLRSIAVVGSFD